MANILRFLLGLILSISLALSGFAFGTWAAGRWLVGGGQGLAGPAEAVLYGAITAALLFAVGVAVSFYARSALLRFITLAALIPAAGVVIFVIYRLETI